MQLNFLTQLLPLMPGRLRQRKVVLANLYEGSTMSASQVVAVDFETRKICPWPDFPPSPVSVSLKRPGQPAEFYAWAHASGNTTTREQVETILEDLWRDSNIQLLFHNSPFDLMVAERHLGLPLPPWQRIHDTRFLLFYHDPYSNDYSLKASA